MDCCRNGICLALLAISQIIAAVASGVELGSETQTGTIDFQSINEDDVPERFRLAAHEFTFEVIQTGTTRYGPAGATGTANYWDWGDLVTVEYRGEDISQKVTGAWVRMDPDGNETIQPEVEDA